MSVRLFGNLNKKHWNRRVWEVGYRGPVMPQQKATGRPDYPISGNMVALTRERMAREWGVMHALTKPYYDEASELAYFESLGCASRDELRTKRREEQDAARMPGKAKGTSSSALWRHGNIGNNLHSNITVEQSLGYIGNRNRWD